MRWKVEKFEISANSALIPACLVSDALRFRTNSLTMTLVELSCGLDCGSETRLRPDSALPSSDALCPAERPHYSHSSY